METSQISNDTSIAIVGSSNVEEFSITDSSNFYQILSSTLYKNQILAVVREVICNAWDAHIAAGSTDKPIDIRINEDNEFIVSDSGLGIPKDQLATIYGTYGLSTKTKDSNQTGGFGLGCKSPFSYTESFQVTSKNQGTSTIYCITRSSPENNGKPAMNTLMSTPTTSTGLEVSIPILKEDTSTFIKHIQQVVFNAGMNATFNGEPLNRFSYDSLEKSWVIANRCLWTEEDAAAIYVKYGSVIYPVPECSLYSESMKKVLGVMKYITSNYMSATKQRSILFLVPPNSISVTPSREALSLQKNTISTLSKVFDDFLKDYRTNFKPIAKQAVRDIFDDISVAKGAEALLKITNLNSIDVKESTKVNEQLSKDKITNWYEFFLCSLVHHNGTLLVDDLHKYAEKYKIKCSVDMGVSKDLAHSYLKTAYKGKWYARDVYKPYKEKIRLNTWINKNIFNPIYKKFDYDLGTAKLSILKMQPSGDVYKWGKSAYWLDGMTYLLSKNILVFKNNGESIKYMKERFLEDAAYLVLTLGSKKGRKASFIKGLTELGFTVNDLSDLYPVGAKKQKTDLKGSNFKLTNFRSLSYHLKSNDVDESGAPPLAVVFIKHSDRFLDYYGYRTTELINKLYGHQIAAVTTKKEYDFFIRKDIPPLDQWLNSTLLSTIQNHKIMGKALSNSLFVLNYLHYVNASHTVDQVVRFINNNDSINKKLIPNFPELTSFNKDIIVLCTMLPTCIDAFRPIKEHLNSVKFSKKVVKLYEKITNNSLLRYISTNDLSRAIIKNHASEEKIAEVLLTIIK